MSPANSDLPPDFLTHLQRTLGAAEDVTVSLLGEWLEKYEPISGRRPSSAEAPIESRKRH
jgi:hypothetical protein